MKTGTDLGRRIYDFLEEHGFFSGTAESSTREAVRRLLGLGGSGETHEVPLIDSAEEAGKKILTIFIDGSADQQSGAAGIGAAFYYRGELIHSVSKSVPGLTNNEAEYEALRVALELARQFQVDKVEIKSDSELLIRQLTGMYKVRNPRLAKRFMEVQALAKDLPELVYQHVPREENRTADKLARTAMRALQEKRKNRLKDKGR